MRTDRRIDPAARPVALAHDVVQRLSHAVQALELEAFGVRSRHGQNGRDRVGVVCRELRIDSVAQIQQAPGAGDVADIGMRLAGEDREAIDTDDLSVLDLGVPVRPLDQPNHDPPVEPGCQRRQPVDGVHGTLAEGLHDDAETVPALQRRVGQHGRYHVQREIEPIRFFRVDIQPHVRRGRRPRQRGQPLDHLGQHAAPVQCLVARVQSRQLDRYPGIHPDVVGSRPLGQSRDRVGIGAVITLGIAIGLRGLSQHVVGVGVPFLHAVVAAPDRLCDVAAQYELRAHLAHRPGHRQPDHRLAEPAHHGMERPEHAPLVGLVHDLPRQHQRPGRSVDQRGRRLAQVRPPVVRCDLVLDQIVDRLGVRHAQQRLGQAHQRHALGGSRARTRRGNSSISPGSEWPRTARTRSRRLGRDRRPVLRRQPRGLGKARHRDRFRFQQGGAQAVAEGVAHGRHPSVHEEA